MFTTFKIQRPHTTSLSVEHGAETTADNEEEICVKIEQYSVIVHYECTQSEIVRCSAIYRMAVIANQAHIQMVKQQGKRKGQSLRTIIKEKDSQTLLIMWSCEL